MNSEMLYEAITELRDEWIEEAEPPMPGRRVFTPRRLALAAALLLVVGLSAAGVRLLGGMGARTGGGGSSVNPGSFSFMSYAGPVLPLTALGETEKIAVSRSVDFDFSPYAGRTQTYVNEKGETVAYQNFDAQCLVSDRYLLTNEGAEDAVLTLLYPAVGSLDETFWPRLSVDGEEREAAVHIGPYAGGFRDVLGKTGGERWNLNYPDDWTDYTTLLSDGESYLASALRAFPTLEQPVTVYRLSDYELAPTDAVNPTLLMSFPLDREKTTVLTWNSNGGRNDLEAGTAGRMISGLDNTYRPPEPMYVILVGDDIESYTLQGYRNGGCTPGEEIDITVTVERYEAVLGEVLWELLARWQSFLADEEGEAPSQAASERLYGCAAELLCSCGLLGSDPAERYSDGMLEGIFGEAGRLTRVLYFAAEVTVPAGGSVEVCAVMLHPASYDFYGAGSSPEQVNGYDLAVRLGSGLRFAGQRASLSHTEEIELVENNFGFDLAAGVTEVVLDPAQEHYWMKVQKTRE